MSAGENKALVREHYRAFAAGDAQTIEQQVAADFIDHDAPPGSARGPGFITQWMAAVHRAFPDLRITLDDVAAEGDRVAVRATWHGTHAGEVLGLPPTQRPVTFPGMVFWRIANGQVAERWATLDRLGRMQQLRGQP